MTGNEYLYFYKEEANKIAYYQLIEIYKKILEKTKHFFYKTGVYEKDDLFGILYPIFEETINKHNYRKKKSLEANMHAALRFSILNLNRIINAKKRNLNTLNIEVKNLSEENLSNVKCLKAKELLIEKINELITKKKKEIHKVIFKMRMEGMKFKDIALKLDIDENYAKVSFFNLIKFLRNELGRKENEKYKKLFLKIENKI